MTLHPVADADAPPRQDDEQLHEARLRQLLRGALGDLRLLELARVTGLPVRRLVQLEGGIGPRPRLRELRAIMTALPPPLRQSWHEAMCSSPERAR